MATARVVGANLHTINAVHLTWDRGSRAAHALRDLGAHENYLLKWLRYYAAKLAQGSRAVAR